MPHPQRFTGESVVSWSDLDITISVPWYLGLMFRTRKEDGVLMEATAGTSSRLHLQVSVSANHTGTCRADKCPRRRTRQRGFPRMPLKGTCYSPPPSYIRPIVDRENAEGNMGDPRQCHCAVQDRGSAEFVYNYGLLWTSFPAPIFLHCSHKMEHRTSELLGPCNLP